MSHVIPLKQYGLIEASGVDAETFLQGQLTCDVGKLAIGQSTVTAHCDPKGKVSAVFRLVRVGEQRFYLLFRTALLPAALDQLKKYAVFSKVGFTPLDYPLVGIIGDSDIDAEIKIESNGCTILINPKSAVEFNADFTLWDLAEIQQGYPILSDKTRLEFIPQALNLQCLEQAVSFQKGCYIGQETVARAKYRGANKRAMYALQGQTDATAEIGGEIEMQLEGGWRKTGTILSAVNFNGVLWLQVVMANQLEEETHFRLLGNQILLDVYPLPYSIE